MFGEKLKALRKSTDMTQQQIADKLGVTRAAYSHFENGRNEPDSETIVKLAKIFEVSTDYLLGHTDSQKDPNLLVATHVDDDLTEEQKKEVQDFIKFIKMRDHSDNN